MNDRVCTANSRVTIASAITADLIRDSLRAVGRDQLSLPLATDTSNLEQYHCQLDNKKHSI